MINDNTENKAFVQNRQLFCSAHINFALFFLTVYVFGSEYSYAVPNPMHALYFPLDQHTQQEEFFLYPPTTKGSSGVLAFFFLDSSLFSVFWETPVLPLFTLCPSRSSVSLGDPSPGNAGVWSSPLLERLCEGDFLSAPATSFEIQCDIRS